MAMFSVMQAVLRVLVRHRIQGMDLHNLFLSIILPFKTFLLIEMHTARGKEAMQMLTSRSSQSN